MNAHLICSDYNSISVLEELMGCEPYVLVLEDCILICDKSTNSVSFAYSHTTLGEFLGRLTSSNSPEGRRMSHRHCFLRPNPLASLVGSIASQSRVFGLQIPFRSQSPRLGLKKLEWVLFSSLRALQLASTSALCVPRQVTA